MWHASVAPLVKAVARRHKLEAVARDQLAGAGDAALGEWSMAGERAFHLRRRLTPAEQARGVGHACDIRGTPEAEERRARMVQLYPALANYMQD